MQRGFTLVELLIVIAILAVLSVTVVVVLNPAELLKQARDATRISDLASINSAIALYLTDVASPGIGGANDAVCASGLARVTFATTAGVIFVTNNQATVSSTAADGTGWVAVDFANITGGSPLSRLPVDPVNNATYLYGYACGTTGALHYELAANMESAKYLPLEDNGKDGGDRAGIYEVGNNLVQ